MSHPFIRRMEAAILQVEARFMAQRGLPSPMLVQEVKERLPRILCARLWLQNLKYCHGTNGVELGN